MKKHLSLLALFAAVLFAFTPMTARAQINEYLSFYCSWASSTVTPTAVGSPNVNLEYSTDKANWTPVTMGTAIDIHTAKVYFRGNNPDGFSKSMTDYVWFNIYVSSNTCTVAGNVMSLVGGAAFAASSTTIPNEYCFYRLFSSGASVSNNYINASAFTLPANNLTTGCYREMFYYTNIKNIPQLPALNLADYCYYRMFYRCLNIATMTTEGVNYVLPAEELKPHCYEYMFGFYNESLSTTFRCEIMATSCQNRTGNDIEKCLASMFNFEVNGTKSWNVYLYIYFKTLGNTSSSTCPTYDWFWGGKNTSRNYIYHDSGINSTTKRNSSNNSPYGAFPYGCTLYSTSYTYLTFDCKTNGGTWEEGSAYNTDLRRVVKANYTAKTIPAPPVKANARFLGWFTTASGEGEMLTEEQLKQITTATTVYARFVDNDKYTLFVNPSDKATITVTDNSSNSYTPGTLYILDSNDKTFTLSCTGVTSGYTFYRWLGGLVDGNTVQFREGQKDMVITGVITAAPAFESASVTVYQVGTGAGTSSVVPLPSEAVDLGDAGIWAKYNVDKTTANGFAASDNATGSYFAWGMTDLGTGYAGASSMTDGETLPVSNETDAAYKYCGSKWRIATKDEWQTLLDNTTTTGPTNQNYSQTFTSNSNGNSIKLKNNGYYSSTGVGPYFETVIMYWTSTFESVQGSGTRAYAYSGSYCNSVTYTPIINAVQAPSTCTSHNYIQYGYAIRPILNVNKRVLTVHTLDFDDDEQPLYHHYFFEADLNQSITVTAVEDDGNVFDHWADSEGNLYSEDNPLTLPMYDNVELTAVFEAGSLVEHHVTFYDEDGSTVLWEDDYREGKKPVYHGDTPTKAGYVFNGWSPAITKLGDSDTYYTATYIQVFTVTASAAHGTVTITPGDPSDQVSENVYKTGTTLTLAVTPDAGWVFTQWTGGNSSNPRSVSVTGDASYTAEFRLESLPAVVDAYQSAPKDVKQILYLLAAQTGDDDKTYTPVDLGVGVAFADRNVGATSTAVVGDYFMWGKTTAATSGYSSGNALSSTGLSNGYTLTAAQDAATQNMGSHWRMPTDDEWVELKNTATISADKSTFTNPNDNTKYITLPASGYYSSSTKYQSGYRFYWSSVLYYSSSSVLYPWTLENYETGSEYAVSITMNGSAINRYYGMPVRAVYVPSYTPVTLTVNAGERQYIYYCQPGQQVTVTAHPNTAANYLFDEWEDNHSDNPERTFVVTANATYTAKMKDNPLATSHSVTFLDYDGTLLQSYDLIDGRNPVYSGAALKRKGYLFKGWTDANNVLTANGTPLPALAGDVVYTATYVNNPYFTITNNHATTATSVSMKESNSNMTNKTFHVRILNAAGEVTTDWTSITVSGTGGTSFGSIPAGGMMLIYGNGGNTATSNYYDYFVISGGTPEISGNILALVACSDGKTVNNNYALPTYCFKYLFTDCTAITNAEDLELPSTTLSQYCYGYMFNGCTGLQKAPKELPATTLGTYCYYYMFNGCSNLEKAPEIRATSLANYCMRNMFYNCSKLKHIRYHGTSLGTSSYTTTNWVSGVPRTGDFYCPPGLSRSNYGANYIPLSTTYKWTVYSYNVTFVPVEGCTWKDATTINKQFTWQTDVEDVTKFLTDESGLGATFYTDAACTSEISVSAITAALATQKESSAATTKNYYVKKAPTLQSLTWDVNGGSALTGDYTHGEIYSGTAVTAPADPTRDGFAFCGWDAGNDGVADEVVTIMPGNDLTYTAIWRQIFTITFKDAENNTLQSGGVAEGSVPVFSGDIPVKASADPDHVYNFTGWTDGNANFTANGTPLPAVTGNTVYTATYAYEMNFLTFTNTHASQTLTVQLKRGSYAPTNVTLNYRVISATGIAGAWQTLTTVSNTTTYTLGDIPAGSRMQFYGNNPSGFAQTSSNGMKYWKFYFGTTGNAVLSGDLMSIFSGTETTIDHTQTLPSYAFYGLFYENSAGNPRILSAKDLKLSATNLGQYCYQMMFSSCANMTGAPTLPATALAAYCYASMFSNCTSLNTAPALPAMTLANNCYQYMFSGCTHLTAAPNLPATTLTESCYTYMFQSCTALTSVPEALPGTNLPQNCYAYMFSGCSALQTAPEILAAANTVPGQGACDNMFASCTALTKAPSKLLPERLSNNMAYSHMLYDCPALTEGPDIFATNISASNPLQYMFHSSGNMRKIRVYFTAWGSMSFSSYWTYNVASQGSFYCPPELTRRYNGSESTPSYIPTNWTVYSYDVTFVPVGGNWADGTNTNKQFTWRTDKSDIDDFIAAQVDGEDNSLIQGWYLNAACTEATSEAEVKADLSVQQTNTTKYVYVRLSGGSSTLTWNFNGGSTTSTESEYTFGTMNEGDPITAPADPTLAGFEFVGWDAGNDGVADVVATTMPSSDLTYTAIWRQIYTITYEGLNGATNSNPSSYTVVTPTITLANPGTRTGYTFTGWTCGGTPITQIAVGSTGDKTITANWSLNTYTLTWSANGGSLEGGTAAGTTAYGTALTAPTATRTGYTFAGWDPSVPATMPDDDATYTAQWNVNSYTLTWTTDGDALTGDYTTGSTAYGTPIAQPNTPTKTGYTFNGWTPDVAETMPAANTEYTATWTPVTYNLTYTGLEGASNSNPETYTIETATFALANPGTRTGYTFTGWTCGGNPITQITIGSTGDKTITANWSLNSHTLAWNANGGTLTGGTAAGTTNYGTALTAPTATRTGYTFNGWDPSVPATMPDADATYTAQWNVNSYTLTWTTDGDELTGDYTSGSTAYGTTIAQPNTPTKTGYTFSGWDTDPAATMPAANTTYTATWNPAEYTVTLNANTGSSDRTTTATYNSGDLTSWTAPTKDGWTLQGYFTATSEGTKVINADGTLVADVSGYTDEDGKWIRTDGTMTLFAQWAEPLNTDLVLVDDQPNDYYDALAATYYGNGTNPVQLTSITFQRTFKAKQWAAFSLPFDWYIEEESVLDGIVYRFTGATGNANDGVYVRFSGELDQNKLEAGKPYLINPTSDITSLTFTPNEENPTLQLSEYILDNDNNQVALYEDGGTESTVRFTATNRRYTLHGRYINEVENPDWKRYVFLNNNRLYYPNASGNTMRPFRGFFYVDGAGSSIAPRVHIVADGQVVTEIEMMEPDQTADEQSASEVRKYVENGILIIERNGVKYNAQGGRL